MLKINLSTEQKIISGIGFATLLITVGGVFFFSANDKQMQEKLNKPLIGEEFEIQTRSHVKEGQSHPPYNSNPPTGGWMYDGVAGAGVHDEEVVDELQVHSLEHGAVIVHYKADLPKEQVDQVKNAYNKAAGRKILMPRKNIDVPVALTSWGRLLKLEVIDEEKLKEFIETNENRAPEKPPHY